MNCRLRATSASLTVGDEFPVLGQIRVGLQALQVPGESPALVSAYGMAFVRGVQGEGGADPTRLLSAATPGARLILALEPSK